MIQIIQIMAYVMIGTVVLTIGGYFLYNRLREGKVRIFFETKDGYNHFFLVRPNSEGFIFLKGEAYKYNKDAITHTRSGFLKQVTPTLKFTEGNPDAEAKRINKSNQSSADLALLANNHVAYDFDKAAGESFGLKQLATYVIVGALVLVGGMGGGFWYVLQSINGS